MVARALPVEGTRATAHVEFFDDAGAPANPDTVTFTTTSGVTRTRQSATFDVAGGTGDPTTTIMHLGLGVFEAQFIGTEYGGWGIEFSTTGPIVVVETSVLVFRRRS